MMLSKAFGYGLRAILFIARENDQSKNTGLTNIATTLDVPRHFLGKIMQDLVKRGIITSVKGPGGGFSLTTSTLDKSVAELIDVIDGSQVFMKCTLGLPVCSDQNPCPLHKQVEGYRKNLINIFKNTTLRDLYEDVEKRQSFLK